nr:protein-disulfide reductase DsbD domain-containing protein [uncultured Cohaesibacter sp.]
MKLLNLPDKIFKNAFCVALVSLVLVLFSGYSAFAEATPWQETEGGRMRLVSAGMTDGRLKAGLEIQLDEGWKTYWKVPGDSGLPPSFDTDASRNAAKIETLWPVPHRIKAGGTEVLGYKDGIIFPFLITPKDAAQSVTLDLAAQVGLCAQLCVPLYAEFSLDIPAGGAHDLAVELLIDRDIALVPLAPSDKFGITDIQYDKTDDGQKRLIINALIPDGYGKKDLFVEAPEGWFLPLTSHMENNVGEQEQFSLRLDGLPENTSTVGKKLTFTLTNGDEAVVETRALEK